MENIFPLVNPCCPATYGMCTVGDVVARQGLRRKGTEMEKMDKPFGYKCPFPSLAQKHKLCSVHWEQLLAIKEEVVWSNTSHKTKDFFHVTDTVPRTGPVQSHCSVTGKITEPKVPHTLAHSRSCPGKRSKLLPPCCLSSWIKLLRGTRCAWFLACASNKMRPLWLCHVCVSLRSSAFTSVMLHSPFYRYILSSDKLVFLSWG